MIDGLWVTRITRATETWDGTSGERLRAEGSSHDLPDAEAVRSPRTGGWVARVCGGLITTPGGGRGRSGEREGYSDEIILAGRLSRAEDGKRVCGRSQKGARE